jgi:HEPN domain-containing protein
MDVARDGIAIYQSDDSELAEPKPKTPDQALTMAREYYEEWFPAAHSFYRSFEHSVADGSPKNAAFQLHQATEQLYHCVMLVCTFYTPHVHNLGFLRTQAERLDRRLAYVWPADTRRERAMFEKLKDAYVKARYSKHYRISAEELGWLGERVEELGRVIHAVCSERIQMLERNAHPDNHR